MPSRRPLWLAAAALLLATPPTARAASFELDPDHSEVAFVARHMMISNVRGVFRQVQGAMVWDDKDITKSTVEVNISTSSLDTQTAKRDDHLRSADFLDAEKYPTITFKSTRVQRAGKGLKVTGDLTIRAVTRPVVLQVSPLAKPVLDPFGMTRTAAQATAKIRRKDFGLEWNKALESGGVLVGEEVTLQIDAEFIKKGVEPPAVPTGPSVPPPAAP